MTNYINYTNDRFMDRDLNELARLENKLNSLPETPTSMDMEAGMIMLKDEQGKIRRQIERKVINHRLENPLESKKYLTSIKQPMSNQNSLNSPNGNASNNEASVTNSDGSISISRSRTINDNGTMRTQTGRIRLMPQYDSANGAPAIVDNKIKDNLFNFSERRGGEEIQVPSGTRTETQNNLVGGATGSQHLIGNAADISIKNTSNSKTATDAYHSNLFDRVNIYSNGGVHVDNKPRPQGSMGFYRDWQRVGNVTPRNKPTPPKKR